MCLVTLSLLLLILFAIPFIIAIEVVEEFCVWLENGNGLVVLTIYFAIIIIFFLILSLSSRNKDGKLETHGILRIPAHCIALSGIPVFFRLYLIPVVDAGFGFGDLINFLIWSVLLFFLYVGYCFGSVSLTEGKKNYKVRDSYLLAIFLIIVVCLITLLARSVDRVAG